MLPVFASKVLVSECPRALVVLMENFPLALYSVVVLLLAIPLALETGNILTLTGPNSLTTTWQYDTLGRKKLEIRANGTITSTNYQWAEDESPNSLYKITGIFGGGFLVT
jgi:YD repeat-containing protein